MSSPRPADGETGVSAEPRPEAYFEETLRAFRAVAASPDAIVVHHIALAGRTIRIEVSKGGMERAILPGLAHLSVPPVADPDLIISAWDSVGTGTPGVSPGWDSGRYSVEGFITRFNNERFHTAVQTGPTILRMLDAKRRHALYWTPSAAEMPLWERGAPMRPLLHDWLGRIGLLAVHGGAVGLPEGGVYLAGAGGRGKSNVALSCLDSELFYASDDFCVLSRPASGWTVHSLYSTGKLWGGDLVRHPHLRGAESNPGRPDEDKALFFLAERFEDRLIRSMPLRAIALPRVIGEGESALVPIEPIAAQKAIVLGIIELSRMSGRGMIAKVGQLVADLPCYELRVGASLSDVPPLIARLLREPHA